LGILPGYDPVTVAIMEARQAAKGNDGPAGYQMFLNVARSLHRQLNGSPFMLPCHKPVGCSIAPQRQAIRF
jgi:hypothetical protein